MTSTEVAKIGLWDENSVKKALKHLPLDVDSNAKSLIKKLLHYDPDQRYNSMRQVLEHPFFASVSSQSNSVSSSTMGSQSRKNDVPQSLSNQSMSLASAEEASTSSRSRFGRKSRKSASSRPAFGQRMNGDLGYVDENAENTMNGGIGDVDMDDNVSVASSLSKRSRKFGSKFRNRFKQNRT